MGKTVTLYCFQYDINANTVYRQEFKANNRKDYYLIHEDTDRPLIVDKKCIDTAQFHNVLQATKIIYVYSEQDNVNKAINLICKEFEETIKELQSQLSTIEDVYSNLKIEQQRIKTKYPNGVKEKDEDIEIEK